MSEEQAEYSSNLNHPKEWSFELTISKDDRTGISKQQAEKLLEEFTKLVEHRGMMIGGGCKPVGEE